MTIEEKTKRREELEAKRNALVDQLAACDTTSASLSSGGGSKSYTNRSVADLKAKIEFLDREIAKIDAQLGVARDPSKIQILEPRFA